MLFLHGMGHYHPENLISNKFIDELDIGSDDEWIMERVGIRNRRTSLSLDYIKTTKNKDPRAASEASSITRAEAGKKAAAMAIERAGLAPSDIGWVISGTSTPELTIPAEAAIMAAELDIDAPCIDINSACSTFLVQLACIARMKPETMPPYVLVINPENYTHVVDYSDRAVAPIFGDGCSAAVISATIPSNRRFGMFNHNSNPSAWSRIKIPRSGHFTQDGRIVQGFAIRTATRALKNLMVSCDGVTHQIKFIGHQANRLMLDHVCERCGILSDNHWHNVTDHGNTGASSAPSVLSQNWNRLSTGDHIAMVVVGAGLTWAEAMLNIT